MAENKVTVVIAGQNDASAVFSQVGSQLESLGSKFENLAHFIEGLAIAEVALKFVEFGKRVFEAEVEMGHLAEKTGVGVEELSALTFAAQLSGVNIEGFEKGMRKLATTISSASAGNAEAEHTLKSVGVAARDTTGHVTRLLPAVEQIADRFSKTHDGANKSALAVQLFGRAGTLLIPFLNQGKDGIKALVDEMEKLGIAMTTKDVQAAEQLKQSILRLQLEVDALMRQFLSGLIPSLQVIGDSLSGKVKDGFGDADGAGKKFGETLKDIVFEGFQVITFARLAAHDIGLFVGGLKDYANLDLGTALTKWKILAGEIDDRVSHNLLDRLNKFADALNAPAKKEKITGDGTEDLERVASDAEAIRKQKDKNELESIKDGAATRKAFNDIELKDLEELNKHELISVTDYFDKKKALEIDSLQTAIRALQFEHDIEEANAKNASLKESERLANLGKVQKLNEQIAQSQAKLSDLQNKDVHGGDSPLKAQAEQMDRMAAQAERLAQRINDIYAVLDEQIARVTTAESNREITTTESDTRINALKAQGIQELKEMTARYNDLAQASGNPKLIINAEKLTTKLDELGKKANWVRDQVINNAQTSFENLFTGIMDGSKTAAQSFADFGKSILSDIDQIIAKMLTMKIISSLSGVFGSIFGGGSIAGAVTGGAAGSGGIDWSTWGLPGHAMGGEVSAGSPTIVGELGPEIFMPSTAGTIIPNSQLGGRSGGGSGATVNIYLNAPGADKAAARQMEQSLQRFKAQIIRETKGQITDYQLRH